MSVETPVPLLSPDRTLEIVLEALRELVDYELAVVLGLEDGSLLRVRKASGPLYTKRLDGYAISLDDRDDLARIIGQRSPHLFDEASEHLDTYYELLDLPEGHSCLVSPLWLAEKPIGLLTLDHRACGKFTPAVVRFVATLSKLVSLSLAQSDASRALLTRADDLLRERNRLLGDAADAFSSLVGVSAAWTAVLDSVKLVAASEAPVLVLGETGTGKEQVARTVHRLSRRASGPFVAVNCSALPPGLAESELFGHEKGSFSGAAGLRRGRFELADGGTLFLDEIGDLPLELQPKLLRALQEGSFERVGGERPVAVDVRIVAATHVDLAAAADAGRFREDLLYRLDVFPLRLPPLRERDQDAALLAERFASGIRRREGFSGTVLEADAVERILALPWPGNVRELRNAVERAAILARGGPIRAEHLVPGARVSPEAPARSAASSAAFPTMEEAERLHIEKALGRSGGKIYGAGGAAALLGLKPSTLQSRMKKLGARRPR